MRELHPPPGSFHRADRLKDTLLPAALTALSPIQTTKVYPKDHEFFLEGQHPLGVYVLYSGRVELSVTDAHGRQLVMRTALPGDALGLSAVISGKFYEETAVASIPSRAGFVPFNEFRRILEHDPEVAFWVVQMLSDRVTATLGQLSCFHQQPSSLTRQ